MKEVCILQTQDFSQVLEPAALKDFIVSALDNDKAFDIETINLQNQSVLADYMIVASGTSSRQVSALASKLKDRLEIGGIKGIKLEGMDDGNWVILDAGDVIVHIFRPEVRDFYQIEKMWKMPMTAAVITPSEYRHA